MTTINVNGKRLSVEGVPADTPLLWVLRDHLGLTGTKYGCGVSECGACTVHLDGVAVQSCVTMLDEVGDSKVTTIEGLSDDCSHPVQQAWREHNVPQCGYCQAGQMMMAAAMLKSNPEPTDEDIESEMWNICRCGTYPRIRAAIKSAAKEMQSND
jgi:isoquinoline 1-oxidoreductase alpha subunit